MKSAFQAILIGVFIFAIIIAVLVFSGAIPTPGGKTEAEKITGSVTIWGILPQQEMNDLVDNINKTVKTYTILYIQKKPDEFIPDLVNAIAAGRGPDIITFDPSMIIRQSDKIYPIPYATLTQRSFIDTYAEASYSFMSPGGTLALPVAIDPLMMYYNKDILSDAGIAEPPVFWQDFIALVPQLSKTDATGALTRSMVGLGEFDNIYHATDIFSLLMLQLGNPLINTSAQKDGDNVIVSYKPTLINNGDNGLVTGVESLKFYTSFSDPVKQTYSWNKTMPLDKNAFIAGKSAFYFGYASEVGSIREKNPHLNFDIARVPQPKNYPTKTTVANVYGFAILKSSKNIPGAFNTIGYLTSPDYAQTIASYFSVAPALRSLLSVKQEDPMSAVIYPSALIAKSWLNPDPKKIDEIYRTMITSVVSGKATLFESINSAHQKITDLLNK
jgi:ABC-type glycerol-3-phosphate transport system substrate-binding protein